MLTRKELKVRYQHSALGFMWSMIQPLFLLVVYTVVFVDPRRRLRPVRHLGALRPARLDPGEHQPAHRHAVDHVQRLARRQGQLPAGRAPAVQRRRRARPLLPAVARLRRRPARAPPPRRLGVHVAAPDRRRRRGDGVRRGIVLLLGAVNVYARDTQHLLDLLVLGWFWVTPILYQYAAGGELVHDHGSARRHAPHQPGHADRDHVPAGDLRQGVGQRPRRCCPTGRRSGTCGPGLVAVLAVGDRVFLLALRVFDRADVNFAETICGRAQAIEAIVVDGVSKSFRISTIPSTR